MVAQMTAEKLTAPELAARMSEELTVPEVLELAVQCHRNGYLDAAEKIYRTLLEAVPQQPDALHFLGVLAHQRGDSAKGIELIQRAIELEPDAAGPYNNLGNVLYEVERFDEAAVAYEKAIELVPTDADAHNNLGAVRRVQGRLQDAFAAYDRAIQLDPRHADVHHNYGNLLTGVGRIKESVQYFCKSITLRPAHDEARRHLGIAYAMLGQLNEAADVYKKWLRDEPGNPIATHMLAACCGDEVPTRAADQFVEQIFDTFARSFDVKLEKLGYRAPELVTGALAAVLGTPAKTLRVLDAGCGTGLCGPLVAPFAARLAGVDLSAQMLAKAQARGVYDELAKGELTEFLRSHPATFDVVISADTLVYFGALEAALVAAHSALKNDGVLVFTVEHDDEVAESGYRLNPHGRYSHSRDYLHRALDAAGFVAVTLDSAVLRMESGSPVAGLVATCRKPAQTRG
jgi:predicted TPR repeat methyltransferase